MHNKKILTKIKLFAGMLLCVLAASTSPVATLVSYAADSTGVSTYANIKEWAYKVIDGKLYKALFNCSTGQYETDWIYVCDWPPEE